MAHRFRIGKRYSGIGLQREMQNAVSVPVLTHDSLKYYVTYVMPLCLGRSFVEVVLDFLEAIQWKDERKPKRDCAVMMEKCLKKLTEG